MIDGVRIGRLAVLVAVALILRLCSVFILGENALAFSDDAKAYHDLGVNLVERRQFATTIDPPHRLDLPYSQRPPLTPFALASVYVVFGPDLLAGQLLMACLSALTVVGLYLLGKQLFSEAVGMLAGVFAAVYPFFLFLAAVPLTENLALLIYTLLALSLTNKQARSSRYALATGGLLGLAALNRPQILGFLPLLPLLVLVDAEREWVRRIRWLGVVLVCSAVVVTPWMIRNHMMFGWVPISLQGGAALHQGNNPYTQSALNQLWAGKRGWYNDPRSGAELNGLLPLDADRKAFRLATSFMVDHPGQSLSFSLQKTGLFLSAYDHLIARASWYPVLAASLLGFFWTARRWRHLLPLYLLILQTLLTAAVFTSMPRFRAPVEQFFLLMAAFAVHHVWEQRAAFRRTK
jgi:4-amino-4-deoxy-L-arabinose transferase-like glycosyltransferase